MPLLTLEIHADPTKEILKGQDEQPKIIKNSQSDAIIFSFLKEVQIKKTLTNTKEVPGDNETRVSFNFQNVLISKKK